MKNYWALFIDFFSLRFLNLNSHLWEKKWGKKRQNSEKKVTCIFCRYEFYSVVKKKKIHFFKASKRGAGGSRRPTGSWKRAAVRGGVCWWPQKNTRYSSSSFNHYLYRNYGCFFFLFYLKLWFCLHVHLELSLIITLHFHKLITSLGLMVYFTKKKEKKRKNFMSDIRWIFRRAKLLTVTGSVSWMFLLLQQLTKVNILKGVWWLSSLVTAKETLLATVYCICKVLYV